MNHTTDTREEYVRGHAIAQSGDFLRIHEELKTQGLLEKSVAFIQEKYENFFAEKTFEPGEKMWEALAIIGLYDTATLEHGLRTFSITKDMTETPLVGPRGESILLKEFVEESGVSLRNLLLASLGHDIGKIIIPIEILHNTLTDDEMNKILLTMIRNGEKVKEIGERIGFTTDELLSKNDEEIIARIYEMGIRPVNIIPLSKAFPQTKYPGMLAILKERGFSENDTIKSVARTHEAEGEKIFTCLEEPIIADLVGHHHNYKKEEENKLLHIMKIPPLKSRNDKAVFGVYNIIKIADMIDSMESDRPYKKGLSKIATLAELAHQSETGRLEKSICYLWVNNEYNEIKETMKNFEVTDPEMQNKNAVETIERFLNEKKKEFDRRYEDRTQIEI